MTFFIEINANQDVIADEEFANMNQNSSVDLLEYVAKLLLYDDIIRHITTISFGSILQEDERFLQVLKDVLPDFEACINSSAKDNVGNLKAVLKIVDQRLSISSCVSKLHRSDEKRLCFEAAFLLLYSNKEEADDAKIRTIPAFLVKYPEFKDDAMIEPSEQDTLLKFRNMMKLAQLFIPAKNHKEHLMDLVTRLVEGRDQKYVTGSGEKPATRRRVLIYEREGGIRPVPRPARMNPTALVSATEENITVSTNTDQISGKKRKECEVTETAPEDIETPQIPEELQQVTHASDENIPDIPTPAVLSSSTSGTSIPPAPKLHHMPSRLDFAPSVPPLPQPSASLFLHEPSSRNHADQDLYRTQKPRAETLSSLLNQHNDAKFIQENLIAVRR